MLRNINAHTHTHKLRFCLTGYLLWIYFRPGLARRNLGNNWSDQMPVLYLNQLKGTQSTEFNRKKTPTGLTLSRS